MARSRKQQFSSRQMKISDTEDRGAQSFNFAAKFLKIRDLQIQILYFETKKFFCPKKFPTSKNYGGVYSCLLPQLPVIVKELSEFS